MYVLWNTHMCIQIWINILCMHGLNICHISSCIGRLSQIEDYWYTSICTSCSFVGVLLCLMTMKMFMNAFHHMIHLALQNTERNRRNCFFRGSWLRIFAIQRHLGDLSSRTRLWRYGVTAWTWSSSNAQKLPLLERFRNWNEKMSTNEF